MSRTTRSFKLKLSPAGMDLLIEAHCHLIRSTRRLIAWGTTLHVAIAHLDTLPAPLIAERLCVIRAAALAGDEEYHVGASQQLVKTAAVIAGRVQAAGSANGAPALGQLYLLALQELVNADKASLLSLHERTVRPPVPTK